MSKTQRLLQKIKQAINRKVPIEQEIRTNRRLGFLWFVFALIPLVLSFALFYSFTSIHPFTVLMTQEVFNYIALLAILASIASIGAISVGIPVFLGLWFYIQSLEARIKRMEEKEGIKKNEKE